jgi:hypothetical protein
VHVLRASARTMVGPPARAVAHRLVVGPGSGAGGVRPRRDPRRGGRAGVAQATAEHSDRQREQQQREQGQSGPATRGAGRRRGLCGGGWLRPISRLASGSLGDDFHVLIEALRLRCRRFYRRDRWTRRRRRLGDRRRWSRCGGRGSRVVVLLEKLVFDPESGVALEKSHTPLSDSGSGVLVKPRLL